MKPVVILLHSSMSSRAQWAGLSAQLETDFRCIAIDLVGYGASAMPAGAGTPGYRHTLAHEADLIEAVLASELAPGEAFHLVGHSYGGACALHLARRMPERVLSLTVFEPVAFHLLAAEDQARADIIAVVERIKACDDARDATRIFIDYWNGPGAYDAAPAVAQAKMAAQIAKVKLDFQALLGEPVTMADMGALAMRTLVLSGQRSPSTTRSLAAQLAAALPNATALQTRGGHMGPITHGDAVNPAIVAFLAGA